MKKTYKILLSFLLILMSGMVFSQSVPSYVPTNGLVGWWGFNGNAQDGSGNGNHGTVNNGLSYTADRLSANNAAIQVIMDWSLCSSPTGFGVTFPVNLVNENYAVSVWVRSYDSIAHNQSIFNSSPHALIGLGLNYGVNNPRNTISSFFGNGSWLLTNNNITWNTSALQDWKHLVVVKFLNELKYYENGSLVFSHFIMPYGQPLTLDSIRFGSSTVNAGCYEPFYGKLDDIGIWNRALSQQEITNLYNSQLPAQTSLCLPTITTSSPTSVGVDTVVIGGDISNDGGSSIALRGICYSTSPNPNMGNQRTEDGSGTGSFNTVLRGLNPSTTYYARSYAKNSNGVVVYGNEVSFTTSASLPGVRCPGSPTVTDIDGNIYNIVQIGTQCWTQSNLKVSKYRNGDSIPTGLSNSQWSSTSSGAYAIYNNDPFNDGLYGKLY
ncbi:MAG: LamG-like jellyroll fold domain-containing protein, partial [Actinomycetes bacterium]